MHAKVYLFALVITAVVSLDLLSQEIEREVIMQPRAGSVRLPSLIDLVQAKLDRAGGQTRLIVMTEAYRMEKRPVRRTRIMQETRTRKQTNSAGEAVEVEYTVNVPVTVTEERLVKIKAGVKPITIPQSDCRFFNLDGELLSEAAASKQLETLCTVFLQDQCEGEIPTIPQFFRDVLKPNCILIFTHRSVRQVLP